MKNANLPDDFDFDQEVINFQFAMMLHFWRGYDKRLRREEYRLRYYFREHLTDKNEIDKMMRRIELGAYHTIPREFWKNIKNI